MWVFVLQKINIVKTIVWQTLDGQPPPDTPLCGFFNEHCQSGGYNQPLQVGGARCSSVVRAFAHGAMGRRNDPS